MKRLVIVWSNLAKNFGFGYNYFKKMLILNEAGIVEEIKDWDPVFISNWKDQKKPMKDLTANQKIPPETLKIPPSELTLGRLEIKKMLGGLEL